MKENPNLNLSGEPRFMEAMDKKGKEFPIKLILWKWIEGSHIFYTGIVRDITEQKANEDKIKILIEMYGREESINKR